MQTTKYDNFFTPLENTMPWLKLAAEGTAGTGKSFTLALITIGLYQRIKSTKPIVIFDTEQSAKFLRLMFGRHNIEVLVKESRTLPDCAATIDYCSAGNADICFIDSITHVWEDFLNDYTQNGRQRIQFQDWAKIKPIWKHEFANRVVNCQCHLLFTGREGFTYDYEEIDGKKTLVKTGVKMKTEGETAYEPDVLLRMERFEQLLDPNKPKEVWREATVLKDRSNLLDGKVFRDPTYDDFAPVVEFLLNDPRNKTETDSTPNEGLIEREESNFKGRSEVKIQLERNEALLDKVAAGTGKAEKALRGALINYAYVGETSELAIARMSLDQLVDAHDARLQPMVDIIHKVQRGEPCVYPLAKAWDAARNKYLGTTNLGEASLDNLIVYFDHMAERDTEIKAKAKEKKEAV